MKIPKILAEKAIASAKENDLKTAVLKLAEGLWILSGVVNRMNTLSIRNNTDKKVLAKDS